MTLTLRRSSIDRFMEKVVRSDVDGDLCWVWTASLHLGYGCFRWDGRMGLAHRFAYEQFVGLIPSGLELDHLCRNTRCVNPEHLEPVTRAENMRRRSAAQTMCKSGHIFDEANTYLRPSGRRTCRECNVAAVSAYKQRKRQVSA